MYESPTATHRGIAQRSTECFSEKTVYIQIIHCKKYEFVRVMKVALLLLKVLRI